MYKILSTLLLIILMNIYYYGIFMNLFLLWYIYTFVYIMVLFINICFIYYSLLLVLSSSFQY